MMYNSEATVANFVQKSFDIISVILSFMSELIKLRYHLMAPFREIIHYKRHRFVWVCGLTYLFQTQKHQQFYQASTISLILVKYVWLPQIQKRTYKKYFFSSKLCQRKTLIADKPKKKDERIKMWWQPSKCCCG